LKDQIKSAAFNLGRAVSIRGDIFFYERATSPKLLDTHLSGFL